MPKIMRPDLKQEIQEAAWKLFYEKGYENTTVNDIVQAAGTSKGGFYYYFEAKEALLNSLYSILDRAYEKYYRNMSRAGGAMEQIRQMNQYVFYFIEGNVRRDLLVALYQSQLSQRKEQHFLNPNRYYMRLLKQIISEGQEKGEIRKDVSVEELSRHIVLLERAILTEWCIQDGKFALGYQGARIFSFYTEFMKA